MRTTTPQKKGTKMNRSLISRPSENFGWLNTHHGLIQTPHPPPPPPQVFQSYPPFTVRQQQPPLLPLPISKPQKFNNSSNGICRGLSCPTPPTNKTLLNNNNSRNRDSSLTPRKSKPKTTTSPRKKEENLKPVNTVAKVVPVSSSLPPKVISSGNKPLCPDPKNLPVNNTNNNTFSSSFKAVVKDEKVVVEYSGSAAFTISPPPPSSLPLPTFSLRPKLCCNTQAAGVDAGATDDLRRLLRLP